MYQTSLLTVLFLLPLLLSAQKFDTDKTSLFLTPAFESLYSTHGNFFYSESITVSKLINKKVELGIGIERAFTSIHHDNGFVLYNLHFTPIFGNIKYHFKNTGKWYPFVESSLGISFNKYKSASDLSPTEKSNVKETGFFTYAGGGVKYAISKNILLVSALGFKGYKMSFNVYDINPHGISYLVGVCFKLKDFKRS